jgi:hypothetical protein
MEPSVGEIVFRRTVSNTFRRLSLQDVQQIAYVRLTGRENTKRFSAAKPQATSLDLMESLEQYGYFSRENVKGLTEVLKDANRTDLAEEIERKLCKPIKKPRNSAAVASPTVESPSRLGDCGQVTDEERRRGERTPVPSLHCGRGARALPVPGHKVSPSPSGVNGGGEKKIPLMPPLVALKKATQETDSQSKIPVRQQLVTLKAQQSPVKGTISPPSKPAPPPPPPKTRSHGVKTEGTGDRDSGMWSGSTYDTVTEWTKHHDNTPAGVINCDDVGGVTQYQHLVNDVIDGKQSCKLNEFPMIFNTCFFRSPVYNS